MICSSARRRHQQRWCRPGALHRADQHECKERPPEKWQEVHEHSQIASPPDAIRGIVRWYGPCVTWNAYSHAHSRVPRSLHDQDRGQQSRTRCTGARHGLPSARSIVGRGGWIHRQSYHGARSERAPLIVGVSWVAVVQQPFFMASDGSPSGKSTTAWPSTRP